jgi:RNA polymerase sigma-70 factor (ECF subfamily)
MVETVSPVESDLAPPPVSRVKRPALTFERVYDDNVDFVWRTLARLGASPAVVEDIAQEVFLVVHRRLTEFEGRSSIKTWLFGIARRVMHDHRRSARRKNPPSEDPSEGTDVNSLHDTQHLPDAAAAAAEATRLLYALLDELDDEKREVFILAELEQIPAQEIATALGISVNTVSSRLRLARAAFNASLARRRARDEWRLR